MSECKFRVGDWVKCIDFEGASGKRVLALKGRDGIYQITRTKYTDNRDYVYLDGDEGGLRAVFSRRFILADPPHRPMDCDSLEDILAEQELYAKLVEGG